MLGKAMNKLKERGKNAVPPKKSSSAYIIFGKEVRLSLVFIILMVGSKFCINIPNRYLK